VLAKPAQLEMADLKDRFGNFDGESHISMDIALHYGVAAYGNIGFGNRLDFSVVGRDVNILSRLELLCKDVGRPLLMTDAAESPVVRSGVPPVLSALPQSRRARRSPTTSR
jgi:class 3 adenylate cyclase